MRKSDTPLALTKAHPNGLPDADGKLLFHMVRLQSANAWQPVKSSDLGTAASDPNDENYLTVPMIAIHAATLQNLRWDDETKPYLAHGNGYTVNSDVFATRPLTIKIACELLRYAAPQGWSARFDQAAFLAGIADKIEGHADASEQESAIKFLLKHRYLEEVDGEGQIRSLKRCTRLNSERNYLFRAEKLFVIGGKSSRAIVQSPVKIEEIPAVSASGSTQIADPAKNNEVKEFQLEKFYDLLGELERNGPSADQRADLRIVTTRALGVAQLKFETLLQKGLRIEILMLNPDNRALIDARYAARTDVSPKTALDSLQDQIKTLIEMQSSANPGKLTIMVSDIQACGFVAIGQSRALLGVMLAHKSFVYGPMIEVPSHTIIWDRLIEDFDARWACAAIPPAAWKPLDKFWKAKWERQARRKTLKKIAAASGSL